MTTEILIPAPAYIVSGEGPYAIPHPYRSASDLVVSAYDGDGLVVVLQLGEDYSVAPLASTDAGDLTLTSESMAALAGRTLTIERATAIEQGWEGVSGPREKGLERQLDRIAQALQDIGERLRRTLKLPPGGTASADYPPPVGGRYIGWSIDGSRLENKSPAVISSDGTFSIFDFAGGQAERAKDPAVADFTEVFNGALATGEKVWLPRWDYRFNTFESVGGFDYAVSLEQDAPIEVDCALGARLILGPGAVGRQGAMMRFKAPVLPRSPADPMVPFRWTGGEFSAVALTAAHGQGSGSGMSFLDLSWFHGAHLVGIKFNGGFTELTEGNNGVGSGFMDSLLTTHGLVAARLDNLSMIGSFDAAIYCSGVRDRLTLAANPFTFTNGSPVVTCAWPAHGLRPGMYVHFKGALAARGVTVFGQYFVASAAADSFTFSAGANATSSGTGGGTAVMATSELSDSLEWSQAGDDMEINGLRVYRCSGGVSSKRNQRGLAINNARMFQVGNGIVSGDVDEPNSYGKGFQIRGGHLRQIRGFPIALTGGVGDTIDGVKIERWGKTLASGGVDFTPVSSGNRIAAIALRSCEAPKVTSNILRQDGAWASGTPAAIKEPVGIMVRADADLAWAVGTQRGHFANNHIDGAFVPILEVTEKSTGNNIWLDNRISNAGSPTVYEASSHVTLPRMATFTPSIVTSGGAVTAEVALGEWWLEHSVCRFYGYVDLLSLSAPTGVVRISGLPYASAFEWPIAVSLTPALIALSAGFTELIGQIESGQSYISLIERNGSTGAIQALPASNLNANTRIAFSGFYRVLP